MISDGELFIAKAEAGGEVFFKHWAKTSKENGGDPELQWYLNYGAMREGAQYK